MPLRKLDVRSLAEVNGGKVAAALDLHIARCVNDCVDRPLEPKPRKVALEILIQPDPNDEGKAEFQFVVTSGVPKHQTSVLSGGLRRTSKNAMLVFNEDSLDDVDQATLLPENGD